MHAMGGASTAFFAFDIIHLDGGPDAAAAD
jgi:hypothetical protein